MNVNEEKDTRPIMVSIRCTTYNHEKYIRDALEGFVMQKTNFRFEAIVHDDASTDGTAAIIREYAEKYPDIIKPIFETENQYSKHDGSLARIMNEACKGKYIALCEGDDYWTDLYKLQKQVDFMESHTDYSMCFHNVMIEADDENLRHQYDKLEEREYTSDEILAEWTVPTCSALIKSSIIKYLPQDNRFICGDIIWFLSAGKYGKIYCMQDSMGVYRRLSTGVMISDLQKNNNDKRWIEHYKAIKEYFPNARVAAKRLLCLKMLSLLRITWSENKFLTLTYCLLFIKEEGFYFIYILLAWFKHLLVSSNNR